MKQHRNDDRVYYPNVDKIAESLVVKFGRPSLGNKRNPFNELLFIILSSKTSLERCREAYKMLRKKFRRSDSLINGSVEEIERTIALAGLQKRKAKGIFLIAHRLYHLFGHVTLAPLKMMASEDAELFLTSLPEVSTKMARCVLLYSLDREVFPVDTHCFRIAQRLGWVTKSALITKAQANELQSKIPPALRRDLHIGMVLLGRQYCTSKVARCFECPINKMCPNSRTNEDHVF